MAYTLRTKDNAGDVGRAADQNESVDNDIFFNSMLASTTIGWNPMRPPASPHAQDEEMRSIGNLTEFDPGAKATFSFGAGGMRSLNTTSANTWAGLYKSIPAGDFTIWTHVSIMSGLSSTTKVGLCLWEDPTNNTKKLAVYHLNRNNTAEPSPMGVLASEFTNYTTWSLDKFSISAGYGTGIYLRMRRNAANYYFEHSIDGIGWIGDNGLAASTWSFTPTAFGIGTNCQNAGYDIYFICPFFRYLASDVTLRSVAEGGWGG